MARTQTPLRIDPYLVEQADAAAVELGCSRNAVITLALVHWLESRPRQRIPSTTEGAPS